MGGPVVTAPLSAELERIRRREEAAAFDASERAMADQLGDTFAVLKPRFDDDARQLFGVFTKWCEERGVRRCAAKPTTIATFILEQADKGIPEGQILGTLAAITAVHDAHALPNPAATLVVRAALEGAIKIEAPRSWPKADKARRLRIFGE